MAPIISVIVTTYNRADLLRGCLVSLCKQTLDKTLFEIIVVDNNSTDQTKEVVESFSNFENIHYYLETRPGMNNARNLGIEKSQGKYIAYIDDDAIAASDWLEVAFQLFAQIDPKPDCLGGPIFPFYTSPKPAWFEDKYEARRIWDSPRFLSKTGSFAGYSSFSGSNMIWRKDVLQDLGGFDPAVGVVGDTLRFGGETILFIKIWSTYENPKLYFSPNLIVHHWVPSIKMTLKYRLKRSFAMGQSLAIKNSVSHKDFASFLKSLIMRFWIIVKRFLKSLIKFPFYPHWQNWVVEELAPILVLLGEVLGLLGVKIHLSQSVK